MMERDAPETVIADDNADNMLNYIRQNRHATNTRLFSFLVFLNAYLPDWYLPMRVCQRILGPPDPIHGGPPFEERMAPFIDFINTTIPGQVCMCSHEVAEIILNTRDFLMINRSTLTRQLLRLLYRGEAEPGIADMVKDLLVKREMARNKKEKFSWLITDIVKQENFHDAVYLLKIASEKFRHVAIYPQTIARLYYIEQMGYKTAAKWAKNACMRDPDNSYVADTVGQVYKNRLLRTNYGTNQRAIDQARDHARQALEAFQCVENKAMREEDPETVDPDSVVRTSVSFNNRGHFGFIQVAKIAFQKLGKCRFTDKLREEVLEKFEFFEWYLTYSTPDMKTLEPYYFWKDIEECYIYYTGNQAAANSTSFPSLLDCLNLSLLQVIRRGVEVQITTRELERIVEGLKTTYQTNPADVDTAMRYILSNIILSNRRHDAPKLAQLTQLQSGISRLFEARPTQPPQPEFYLPALMLFWPDEQLQQVQQEADDKEEGQAAEDDESGDGNKDEDQERGQEGNPPPPPLQQHVTSMKNAYDGTYARYLRGRHLLPLFFLGKGQGLRKWIHKSRLDAIVEDSQLAGEDNTQLTFEEIVEKKEMIHAMWCEERVWQIPRIRNLLLPVQVETEPLVAPAGLLDEEVSVRVGEQTIQASLHRLDSRQEPEIFYLYLTIEGPVVINVPTPHDEERLNEL